MRKYAWLLAFAVLAALAILTACSGEAVPSTPRSTITPTFTPSATTTSSTPTQTGGIPGITHSIAGRENCLVCHENGIAGSVIIPDDHAGRTNETCTACHQPLATGTATATATGTATSTATQPAGIPQVPHDITGRTDCRACHETGIGGATVLPANHAGRGNDICTACHQAASSPTVTIALIPHSTAGLESCLQCHQTGVGGAPVVPGDHAGFANAACAECHFASASPTTLSFPRIPHFTDGFESCLVCHGAGIGGAPAVPADHAGRTEATCSACHVPATSQVALQYPVIEHGLAGRDDCWLCHRTGIINAPIPPSDHADRTTDTCTVCHKVG